MAALNTDKLKKLSRRWVGQIGSGGVADDTATTIPLSSTTNLATDTAVVATIDRVDANGTATPNLEETVIGVVSGSNLVNCVRGSEGTAQAHSAGAVVEILVTAKGWNDLVDHLLVQHDQLGYHTNITASNISASAAVTSLHYDLLATGDIRDANDNELLKFTQTASAVNEFTVANTATGNGPSLCATGGDSNIDISLVAKGTGGIKDKNGEYLTPYNSLYRQALINGNFDVWQRGTSFTAPTDGLFTADRVKVEAYSDGGTPPTIIHSRQLLTSGDVPNSFYYYNINVNGAGSSFGNGSYYMTEQRIEHGTRFLCGLNRKVTLSFWAKSDITGKKLGIYTLQTYGTGGSPSSAEVINGTNIILTSSWTKYTYTITTNTLVGKTFGTNGDDFLRINFVHQWGSTFATNVGAGSNAETFVGSGNICITQVQLCAGDVALPFMPKSFEEELRACMRYYEKSYKYADAPTTTQAGNETGLVTGIGHSTNTISCSVDFAVRKRVVPTVLVYKYAGTVAKISNFNANDEVGTAVTANLVTEKGICRLVDSGTGFTAANRYWFCWTAEAEL